MRAFFWFFLFFLLAKLCLSVDRNNFKTCAQSSFCSRQRSLSENTLIHRLDFSSFKKNDFGFSALILSSEPEHILTLDVSYYPHNSFHLLIDEKNKSEYRRYRVPSGDVLLEGIKAKPVTVTIEYKRIVLLGSEYDKAIVNIDPFWIEFYKKDELLVTLNKRGLLNFEHTRKKVVESVQKLNINESKNVEGSADDNNHEPVHNDEALTDSKENVDNNDGTNVNEDQNEDLSWTETFKEFSDFRPHGLNSISLDIDFTDTHHAYGIPEHADGLPLRSTTSGDPYRLYNLDVFEYEVDNVMALYGSVPLIWAHNVNHTVGAFWLNPSETWIDVENTGNDGFLSKIPKFFNSKGDSVKTRWISESGLVDLFIFLGDTPSDISKAYSYFTGTTKLPPLFSIGYHQSRWNYHDQNDVENVDKNFDEYEIPVDVIWLDIEHTDGKRYFTWDKIKFSKPEEMVDKLTAKGRKLVTAVDPHIKKDSNWNIYQDAQKNDIFVKNRDGNEYDGWCWPGSSSWPDFTNPVVRHWWSRLFLSYHPFRKDSMFTWNDMGEPSVFSGPEVTMSKDAIHVNGWENRDIHNMYGLYVHQATWEGQLLRSEGMERPFVLTRAFFAGSQRTSAVWTGDNYADWNHLKYSVPMLLSLSISGITFCGADVGGFFNNPDPELLTRWYQAAAFQPFFRAHSHMDTKRREPWLASEENLNLIRVAISTRYNLLPYWYTMFARSEANGHPIMAPMWYHFSKDVNTFGIDNQHMVGEAILVHPVVQHGATSVNLYLPKGVWYHMATFEQLEGDGFVSFSVNMATIPAFYRGGWIIPRKERIRRSSMISIYDPYTLIIALDPTQSKAMGYVYFDDFHSTSFHQARFYEIQFEPFSNKSGQWKLGGRLRLIRLPMPGYSSFASDTNDTNLKFVPKIERLVFLGLEANLNRVIVVDNLTGKSRNLEFTINPSANAKFRASMIIVRKPDLFVNDQWELHLITEHNSKEDL